MPQSTEEVEPQTQTTETSQIVVEIPKLVEVQEISKANIVITKHRAIFSKPGDLREFIHFKSVAQIEPNVVIY